MSDWFQEDPAPINEMPSAQTPLAARMRPQHLDEVVGQQHLLAPGKLLRRAIEADRFSSLILYGPPGVGKTTLAMVIAKATHCRFESLNGVESNVSEMRAKVDQARHRQEMRQQSTILFVDEIHRFNKAQQDVLLPHIERGTIRFIGATTHNPFFYLNSPLVSRSQVFQLEPVEPNDLIALMQRALSDPIRGLGQWNVDADPAALAHLADKSDGDARKALTSLEIAITTTAPDEQGRRFLSLSTAEESIQQKAVVYDADGDGHYDTISAFIKSIRGSDPDAAIYWLAKMLHAGEDLRFIARRLVISASEDIGLADSNALRIAIAAQQAVDFLGMPEARIPLAHATIYLATAPKSNSAYLAIDAALADVRQGRSLPVPPHLRSPTRKKLAALSGTDPANLDYLYSHDSENGYIPQAYLPEGRRFYEPKLNGMEQRIAERLAHWRTQFEQSQSTSKS